MSEKRGGDNPLIPDLIATLNLPLRMALSIPQNDFLTCLITALNPKASIVSASQDPGPQDGELLAQGESIVGSWSQGFDASGQQLGPSITRQSPFLSFGVKTHR